MSQFLDVKVLMVDDEVNALRGFQRILGRKFALTTASSGPEALEIMKQQGPFGVVVTDMRMPEMTGVEFLAAARLAFPETVYMMLTGNADQQTAIDAINSGRIFRFLNKPCPSDLVELALHDGIQQYRLVTSERELLRKTLAGSIQIMMEALSLADPNMSRRTDRVRRIVTHAVQRLNLPAAWQFTTAASLCLVGLVTLPRDPQQSGLSEGELLKCAEAGSRLMRHIPRMETVAEMIGHQRDACYDPEAVPLDDPKCAALVGAQLLRIAVDLEQLAKRIKCTRTAVESLRESESVYDERLLNAIVDFDLQGGGAAAMIAQAVSVLVLRTGMILDGDLHMTDGSLLLSHGHELTMTAIERLKNFYRAGKLRESINVLLPQERRLAAA